MTATHNQIRKIFLPNLMRFKLLILMRYVIPLFFIFFGGVSQANDFDKESCFNLTTKDKTYRDSYNRLLKLEPVSVWVNRVNASNKHPALGTNVDKPKFKNGSCYWSISLYESDELKLQLWRIYLVEINKEKIFLVNVADDSIDPIN